MTTTYAWLETYKAAGLALSMVIEGIPEVFSTDALENTYSTDAAPYDQWTDPDSGKLVVQGVLTSKIDLYAQDLKPTSLEFRVIDPSDTLAALMLREQNSSGTKTFLAASITAGSTSNISVKPMATFTAPGTVYIGGETISYTGVVNNGSGKTTTLTGITRSRYSVNTTDSGARFAPAHTIGNNVVATATTAPVVTSFPRTWYGRFVHLFLHVKDPITGQYNLPSQATKLWSGRIEDYGDDGDGGVSISATSASGVLQKHVGHEQWYAHANEGRIFGTLEDEIKVYSQVGNYFPTAQLTTLSDGQRKNHEEVAAAIMDQFNTWATGGQTDAGDLWEIRLVDFGDGSPMRYRFRLAANSVGVGISNRVEVSLNVALWRMLGWDASDYGHWTDATNGDRLTPRLLVHTGSDNVWELTAPKPPIIYDSFSKIPNQKLPVTDEIGTFYTQSPADLSGAPPDCNGCVVIKTGQVQGVFGVKYEAGTPSTIRLLAELDPSTGEFVPLQWGNATSSGGGAEDTPDAGAIRLGQVSEPPIVKQAWYESGSAGDILLKALLSTGNPGYNHADFDVFGWGGVGIPSSLIDVGSWEDLNEAQIQFLITEPKPFHEYLEPVLNVTGSYVVWKAASADSQPKLAVIKPTLDNNVQVDWALTESNKAKPLDRMKIRRAVDGIINRVVVKFGQGLDGQYAGAKEWIVEDVASQTDYGRRRTVTIQAPLVTNVANLAPATISPALAYFSRPLAAATRSYNGSLIRMAPGDSASVTDLYAMDPGTGTRGAVLYGWVMQTDFDLKTLTGQAKIVFLPEKAPRPLLWSPSAKIDLDFFGGSAYDAGTKTATIVPHEYSASYDTNDALRFNVGDKVHIYELDNAAGLEWNDEITSVTATTLSFLVGLAGFDTTKRYVIEAQAITNVTDAQKNNHAFIADDADLTTGGTIQTAYDWGTDGSSPFIRELGGTVTIDYTRGMFEPNSTYANKGQPMSIHKQTMLVDGLNNLLANKTRTVHLNHQVTADLLGTTTRVCYVAWVPIYGHAGVDGNRGFKARLRGYVSGGGGQATFTISSSPSPIFGTSFSSYTFPRGRNAVAFSTTAATPTWSSELSLSASPAPAAAGSSSALPGTWIFIECSGSLAGTIASLRNVYLVEEAL